VRRRSNGTERLFRSGKGKEVEDKKWAETKEEEIRFEKK